MPISLYWRHMTASRRISFFYTRRRVLSYNLCLKFRHVVDIASTYIPDRRQCQPSQKRFSSDSCLCAGSLLSVDLFHSFGSWFLECIALGSSLPSRWIIRFLLCLRCLTKAIGSAYHRGDLCVAALDLLLHVCEIGSRYVKITVQLHVLEMKPHLAPQCCHGLVVLDLPTASPQLNESGNDMKQETREKQESRHHGLRLSFNRHIISPIPNG